MNSRYDFTQGNILSKMVRFMLPVLGALILQAMYGAVDILVVGRFGTAAGISGVSTGSSAVNLIVFAVAGLSMGVTVVIGRYLGEKRAEKAGEVIGGAIVFFVILAAAVTVFMLTLARPFAVLLQAPPEALDQTVTYIRICGGGILFIIAYNVISSIFRGLGDSRMPLIFVAIACAVNITGDLLFVAVFRMDVAGAALATVMAQAVSVILSLLIIRKRSLPFTLTRRDIRWNPEIPYFLRVGAPVAFQDIMTNVSFLALLAFINRIGLEASSGYGVANKLVSFIMLVPAALMQSMASFVAQNVGARREDRARQAMLTGMAIGGSIGVVIGLVSFFFGDRIAMIFTEDPGCIMRAWEYLRGFAPEAVITAILFSFMGYFNGHEKTVFVMAQGLAQTFLVRLPFAWYMSIQPDPSLTRIGWAAPVATVFGIAVNLVYYLSFRRKMRQTQQSPASG